MADANEPKLWPDGNEKLVAFGKADSNGTVTFGKSTNGLKRATLGFNPWSPMINTNPKAIIIATPNTRYFF